MGGLVELARQYVALSDQLETVRRQIKLAVMNGGEMAKAPFVRAARPGEKSGSQQAKAIAAAAERKLLDLIRQQPGTGTAALARSTGAKVNTSAERLKRMKLRGEVHGGGAVGWTASD